MAWKDLISYLAKARRIAEEAFSVIASRSQSAERLKAEVDAILSLVTSVLSSINKATWDISSEMQDLEADLALRADLLSQINGVKYKTPFDDQAAELLQQAYSALKKEIGAVELRQACLRSAHEHLGNFSETGADEAKALGKTVEMYGQCAAELQEKLLGTYLGT